MMSVVDGFDLQNMSWIVDVLAKSSRLQILAAEDKEGVGLKGVPSAFKSFCDCRALALNCQPSDNGRNAPVQGGLRILLHLFLFLTEPKPLAQLRLFRWCQTVLDNEAQDQAQH